MPQTSKSPISSKGGEYAYAGGITGHNLGLIAFCRTGGNVVTARNATDYNRAGGLVGYNRGSLYSCYSRATAEVPAGANANYAGAIVGGNDRQGDVQHCYGVGVADQGTSNLAPTPGNIFYETNPGAGEKK